MAQLTEEQRQQLLAIAGALNESGGADLAGEAAALAAPRSFGDVIYDNVIGNPDDGVESYGEQFGTWLNRAGESATLGVVGDEASAAVTGQLPGRSYEGELERYRQNEENMPPPMKLSADVAGAFIPGVGMVGPVMRGATAAGRVGRGMIAGGAAGATNGFMEGQGSVDDRAMNGIAAGAVGLGVGAAVPALGKLFENSLKGVAERRAIKDAAKGAPSSEQLRQLGSDLYRQVDEAGVQIRPEAFDRMREATVDRLRNTTGFDELPGPGSLTPNTARVMEIMGQASNKMAEEPTAALPFRSLDQIRRKAGAASGNVTNKADRAAGVAVIEQLDDFVRGLKDEDVAGGDVQALQSAIGKAREVWSRMSKSQLVDDAMERSGDAVSNAASGVRNQFKSILRNKKLAAGFTDAEKRALRSVTQGSALDQIINLAGGGLAQMGSIGTGAMIGGLPGAILGAGAAAGQRKLAEAVTMRNAEKARAAIASGRLANGVEVNPALAELFRAQMLGQSGNVGAASSPLLRGQ